MGVVIELYHLLVHNDKIFTFSKLRDQTKIAKKKNPSNKKVAFEFLLCVISLRRSDCNAINELHSMSVKGILTECVIVVKKVFEILKINYNQGTP